MNEKIDKLLELLTLEEKIALLAGADTWHTAAVPRLGIPAIKVTDGPYGARTLSDQKPDFTYPATCFPTGVAMAATWDVDMVHRIGEVLGEETRERACAVLLGPCVNIHRTPLGGRNFESFSEDPFLSSNITVAFIKGVQSRRVGVSVKHFALNNQEFERFSISSEVGERAAREIFFPSFEKAVKVAGAWTVMCSYNKINGTHASENEWLLTRILKEEWGFKGLVMSDWFATHSTIEAAKAGLDLEMPGPPRFFGRDLLKAVEEGRVSLELINDKVARILSVMEKYGAFDRPVQKVRLKNTASRRRLARQAAAESFVLLKNAGRLLPLSQGKIKTLAVIGPNAACACVEGGGSSMVKPYYKVSPLEALKKACSRKIKIRFEPGCRSNRLTPVLPARLVITENGKPGLKGEYFTNNELAGGATTERTDRNFNLRWFGDKPPARNIKFADFSVRWSGFFKAPLNGCYKFGLLTQGWARILVDSREIVSTRGAITASDFDIAEENTGECELQAGRVYSFTIEYRKNPSQKNLMRSLRIGCELPLPEDMFKKAVEAASSCDYALVFAGLNDEWESEGFDRKDLKIPAPQSELIKAVAAANPKTVVVLNNGSPLEMTDWVESVPAVLEAWFPGQECGNAIVDVLFGRVNPCGKLPDTFPRSLADHPSFPYYPGSQGKVLYGEDIFTGYRYFDKNNMDPLFPFGFGLSYTDFVYSNLRITPENAAADEKFRVEAEIKNTGRRSGKEIVQLYISDVSSSLPRPPRELKAFQKVTIKAGQKAKVVFELGKETWSFWDPARKGWVAEPGDFEVLVGSSSRDIRLRGKIRIN